MAKDVKKEIDEDYYYNEEEEKEECIGNVSVRIGTAGDYGGPSSIR